MHQDLQSDLHATEFCISFGDTNKFDVRFIIDMNRFGIFLNSVIRLIIFPDTILMLSELFIIQVNQASDY